MRKSTAVAGLLLGAGLGFAGGEALANSDRNSANQDLEQFEGCRDGTRKLEVNELGLPICPGVDLEYVQTGGEGASGTFAIDWDGTEAKLQEDLEDRNKASYRLGKDAGGMVVGLTFSGMVIGLNLIPFGRRRKPEEGALTPQPASVV